MGIRGGDASVFPAVATVLAGGAGVTGVEFAAAASATKLLIVAEDKNTDSAGFALAPFFIRRELQARFGTITQIL
jgi:hypothetical protein